MSAGEPAPDLPAHIMKRADESYKFSMSMLREIYLNEFEYKKTGLAVFSERAHQAKAELDRELDLRTGIMSLRLNAKAFSPPRRQIIPRSSYMGNNNGNNNGKNNKKTRKRQRKNTPNENESRRLNEESKRLNEENKNFQNKLRESTRISREAVQEENRRERQAIANEEDRQAAAEAAEAAEEEEGRIPAVRRGTLRNTMLADSNNGNKNNNKKYGQAIKASQEF
jgi:hypothetical protein